MSIYTRRSSANRLQAFVAAAVNTGREKDGPKVLRFVIATGSNTGRRKGTKI
jgi:hypothetical protein